MRVSRCLRAASSGIPFAVLMVGICRRHRICCCNIDATRSLMATHYPAHLPMPLYWRRPLPGGWRGHSACLPFNRLIYLPSRAALSSSINATGHLAYERSPHTTLGPAPPPAYIRRRVSVRCTPTRSAHTCISAPLCYLQRVFCTPTRTGPLPPLCSPHPPANPPTTRMPQLAYRLFLSAHHTCDEQLPTRAVT